MQKKSKKYRLHFDTERTMCYIKFLVHCIMRYYSFKLFYRRVSVPMNSKTKGLLKLIGAIIVIGVIGFIAIRGIGEDKAGSASDVSLGLDLAGGVSVTYEIVDKDATDEQISDTVYKMQLRSQNFSNEAQVSTEGANRITVSIPSVTDADEVLRGLGSAGNIYFIYGMGQSGTKNIETYFDEETSEYKSQLCRTLADIEADGDVVIDGKDIATAKAVVDQDQYSGIEYKVQLDLNAEGREKFASATSYSYGYVNASGDDALRNIIAIVYDNEVVSAPHVAAVITDGKAVISGQKTNEEASLLASTIRIGALPLELSVLRYYVEGAQLGSDALNRSLIAGAIGFAAIILIMILLYRVAGVSASLALTFYIGLVVICLNLFQVTLTLPGIAGIILSIGMAVDANVIIFTRIQEEIATGKTVRSSIKLGFSKALSAIIDGNVTTIIAAIVLYYLGSGTVKGFAQTLAIGIILSMITALFVTKFLLGALFDLGADKPVLYGKKREVKTLNIAGNFKKFLLISGGVIAVGIIAVIINFATIKTPFSYGLDFSGGTVTAFTLNDGVPAGIQSEVEAIVLEKTGMNAEVSVASAENTVRIKTKELSTDLRANLISAISSKYNVGNENITTETVGATVSSEMKKDALIAVIVATIGMLLYIWIRFKNINFGTSAVFALIHDVLVVLTVYAVARAFITVGNTFIACMLTIVGYSINATIIIFDRIRENLELRRTQNTTQEIVDISITQTFSRSIYTSLTTLVMVVLLAILGVRSVREFAIPLMAGILCGFFSSVCLAGGMWYFLQRKFRAKESKN